MALAATNALAKTDITLVPMVALVRSPPKVCMIFGFGMIAGLNHFPLQLKIWTSVDVDEDLVVVVVVGKLTMELAATNFVVFLAKMGLDTVAVATAAIDWELMVVSALVDRIFVITQIARKLWATRKWVPWFRRGRMSGKNCLLRTFVPK